MARPEALRLLRIARRDLRMARRLLDPEVEEASWGWAAQQCLEKALKAWLHHLGSTPPSTHDISRLLLLLQEAGIEIKPLLPLRAFTSFAVQYRYDDEPDYWESRVVQPDGRIAVNVLHDLATQPLDEAPDMGRLVQIGRYKMGGHRTLDVPMIETDKRGHVRAHRPVEDHRGGTACTG